MPSNLPPLDKTWQHFHGAKFTGAQGKDQLLELKNAFIGFALSPWTVTSSSNATLFGNNDNVDHWQTIADLTQNQSWTVWQQTGIRAKTQVRILFGTFSSNDSISISISPSVGYGSANGGTDGTATVPPTATDEISLTSGVLWRDGNSWRNEVWMSTDGQVTRSTNLIAGGISTENLGILDIELLKNPTPSALLGGTPGVLFFRDASVTETPSYSYTRVNDGSTRQGVIMDGLGQKSVYQATIGEIAAMTGQNMTTGNEVESAFEFYPVWIRGAQAGAQGILGVRYDHWFGQTINPHGTTFPAPPDIPGNQFIQFADQIIPWDGTPSNLPF